MNKGSVITDILKSESILLQLCVAELAPLLQFSETPSAAPPLNAQSSSGLQNWGPYCSLCPQRSTCGLKRPERIMVSSTHQQKTLKAER